MNRITILLQNDIKSIMDKLGLIQRESADIYNAYTKTDASTQVEGLGSDSDPATVETKFTKKNYIDGKNFCQNLDKFFSNQVITQADYIQTIDQCRYGNAVLATALSVATEEIGKRIKQICIDMLEVYKLSLNVIDSYEDNEIDDIVGVLDNDRVIPGSDMTKIDLQSAITLLTELNDLLTNGTVTQGDYAVTIAQWNRLTEIEW